MSFHLLGLLSGLAYLALCLLVAGSCAWRQFRLPDQAPSAEYRNPPDEVIGRFAEKNSKPSAFPTVLLLSVSGLIALLSFLFLPCGTLPAFSRLPHNSAIVLAGLGVSLGLQSMGGWRHLRRLWAVPFCLGISMAVMALYAQQRGIPGELYSLDAYSAMPVFDVANVWGKLGMGFLALASLLALWNAIPVVLNVQAEDRSGDTGSTLSAILVFELWILAATGFWVCLFFPGPLAYGDGAGISSIGNFAVNALWFWAKILGLNCLLGRVAVITAKNHTLGIACGSSSHPRPFRRCHRENGFCSTLFFALSLLILMSVGGGLLLGIGAA